MATPRWREIADDLRRKIESGDLGKDAQPLPTEQELQELYSASRNTVRDAVKQLVNRGLVYTRSGQGTFVTPKIEPFVTRLGGEPDPVYEERTRISIAKGGGRRTPDVSAPEVDIKPAAGIAAAELGLQTSDTVIRRLQRWSIDGKPCLLQATSYPMDFFERGAVRLLKPEDITEGAVHYLEKLFGFKEVGRRDRITSEAPDDDEAKFFGLPDDGLVKFQELIRTGFRDGGQPIRVTVTKFPIGLNQLVIDHGEVPSNPDADGDSNT